MATSFKGWGTSWGNSWGPITVDPNAMQGSASFSITASLQVNAGEMQGSASFAINAIGTLTPEAPFADTHDGYFTNTWLAQWKKKPELSEVIEYVQAHPQEAIEIAQGIAPSQTVAISVAQVDYSTKIAELLAKQILYAISRRQLELQRDEDDAEFLLLMD